MSYLFLKHAHMTLAATSITLFVLRGLWTFGGSPLLAQGWARRTPHLVDSLLLASAIALAWRAGVSPLSSLWLGAKVSALVAYILLGSIALKYGRTRGTRLAAFAAAIACFGYIATTAVTKDPLFFF